VKLAPTDRIEPPPCPLLNQEGKLVYELYGITDEERALIENT
jgi:hypothetical protein